jgi:hypothetical protein
LVNYTEKPFLRAVQAELLQLGQHTGRHELDVFALRKIAKKHAICMEIQTQRDGVFAL